MEFTVTIDENHGRKKIFWKFHLFNPPPGVWKFENPHCRVKNQSCRKLYIWVSKPIRRKIQNQRKKTRAQSDLPVKRKIPKTTRMNLVPENRFLRVVLLVFLVLFHSGQRLTATAIRQDRAARSIQTLPWFDPFFVAIENHWKQWWNDTKNHSCKHAFLCKLNLRNFLCIRFSKPKVASPSKAGSLRQYQCKRK